MNGIHDLGGVDGLGPVEPHEPEQSFSAPWETDVFGTVITLMGIGLFNQHEFRHAIERMDPVHYLESPYYEHWLVALETLLVEKDVFSIGRLRERLKHTEGQEGTSQERRDDPELTRNIIEGLKSWSPDPGVTEDPQFEVGEPVRVRNHHPRGHTRCPRYVRGGRGVIERQLGASPLPDDSAHGGSAEAQSVYTVRFEASELWGEKAAEPNQSVSLDLWEGYLAPT